MPPNPSGAPTKTDHQIPLLNGEGGGWAVLVCVSGRRQLVLAVETRRCPLVSTSEDIGPLAPLWKNIRHRQLLSKDIFHPEVFASRQKNRLSWPLHGLLEA